MPAFLKADDRGFVFNPSFTSMAGIVDNKVSLKTAIQAEMTYLIFNQFEFGVGLGFHRQHMTQTRNEDFYAENGELSSFVITRAKSNAIPYYGVLRYNFDLFEDGWLVAAVKFGSYYLLPRDRTQSGSLFASVPEGEQAPVLRYDNEFTRMSFFATTLGYDLDNIVISLEYRNVSFKQNLSLVNETTNQTIKNSYNRSNHYIGLNVSYRIDLF
jgi:hypothetical protein